VLDMNTVEAAKWIQQNRDAFTTSFSATAIVKDRAVAVIVEYVPVSHTPDALAECRKIERESGLAKHTLLSTRWIKNPERRTPGQRTAHIIARFSSAEAANNQDTPEANNALNTDRVPQLADEEQTTSQLTQYSPRKQR
jgi:hypothetical protein